MIAIKSRVKMRFHNSILCFWPHAMRPAGSSRNTWIMHSNCAHTDAITEKTRNSSLFYSFNFFFVHSCFTFSSPFRPVIWAFLFAFINNESVSMNEKRTESTSIVSQNNVNNRGKGKSLGSLYDGFDTERTLWLLLKKRSNLFWEWKNGHTLPIERARWININVTTNSHSTTFGSGKIFTFFYDTWVNINKIYTIITNDNWGCEIKKTHVQAHNRPSCFLSPQPGNEPKISSIFNQSHFNLIFLLSYQVPVFI